MFGEKSGKPVDVIAVESFRLDGNHVERFTVIENMAPDLAMELAGAGKVRLATKDSIAEAKAAKANMEKIEAAKAAGAPSQADVIAAAVAAALQQAGVVAKPA